MAKIFYVDHIGSESLQLRDRRDELVRRLNEEGLKMDCLFRENITAEDVRDARSRLFCLESIFSRDVLPRITEYEFLIAHLGSNTLGHIQEALSNNSHLKAAMIASLPDYYEISNERILICSYNNLDELITFIKGHLNDLI